MSAHLESKHQRAFKQQLDLDGNGYIEREDFEAFGVRVLSACESSPTSAKGKALVGTVLDVWEALRAQCDIDGDGRISPQEYHRGMTGAFVHADGGYDRTFRPAVRAVLELADADGDGTITPTEFRALQAALGTPDGEVDAAFRRLDAEGLGAVSIDRIDAAARQFYTGEGQEPVGDLLFGAS